MMESIFGGCQPSSRRRFQAHPFRLGFILTLHAVTVNLWREGFLFYHFYAFSATLNPVAPLIARGLGGRGMRMSIQRARITA